MTKNEIANYCVDSKGDPVLAAQIAMEFEKAGFEIHGSIFDHLKTHQFIGINRETTRVVGWAMLFKVGQGPTEIITLPELIEMIDKI